MKIINLPRGKGKTSALVRISAATRIPILYASPMKDLIFYQRAKELNLDIPKPVQYTYGVQGKYLIDELEHFFSYLGLKIEATSLTETMIKMTEEEVLKLVGLEDIVEIVP